MIPGDPILGAFLSRQHEEGMALARASDILELVPVPASPIPPMRYRAIFRCRGLVMDPVAGVVSADRFEVGIRFPPDYLRHVRPMEVLCLLAPLNVWHPNVAFLAPFICAGRLLPGTRLADILYQLFEILTWNKFALADPLNADASQWARAPQHLHRFPTDPRPLKRRNLGLRVESPSAATPSEATPT